MKHRKKHITKKRNIIKRRRFNRRKTYKKYDGGINFNKFVAYALLVLYGANAVNTAIEIRKTGSLPPRPPPPSVRHLTFDDDAPRRDPIFIPNTLATAVTSQRAAGESLRQGTIETAILTKFENERYGTPLNAALDSLKQISREIEQNQHFKNEIDRTLSSYSNNVNRLTEKLTKGIVE